MRNLWMIALIALPFLSQAANSLAAIPQQETTLGLGAESESQDDEAKNKSEGPSTWTIDTESASVVCAVSHYGLSFIYGRFNTCSGQIELDHSKPNETKFKFEIDPNSLDSNNLLRDIQLRGTACLDVLQYDSIKFESTSVQTKDGRSSEGKFKRTFHITGDLSLHGVTREITIPLEFLGMGNGHDEKLRCGFMSRFVIKRSDFGIDRMKESVGENVAVTFCFQAKHQIAEPADVIRTAKVMETAFVKVEDPDSGLETGTQSEEVKQLFRTQSSYDEILKEGEE